MIIKRDRYLRRLVERRGNGLIKVVTGVRRCGKSFLLLDLFHQYLVEHGVQEDHIIEIPLDDRANKRLRDPDALLSYVRGRIAKDGAPAYVILDEIQLVEEFEDVLNSLLHDRSWLHVIAQGAGSCDKRRLLFNQVEHVWKILQFNLVILTGSQNFLLLDAVSQSLAGRVGLVTLLPFSLDELSASGVAPESLEELLIRGGYPRLYDVGLSPVQAIEVKSSATYNPRFFDTVSRIAGRELGLGPQSQAVVYGGEERLETERGSLVPYRDLHERALSWLA